MVTHYIQVRYWLELTNIFLYFVKKQTIILPDHKYGNVHETGHTRPEPDAHRAAEVAEEGVPRKHEYLLVLRIHQTADRDAEHGRTGWPLIQSVVYTINIVAKILLRLCHHLLSVMLIFEFSF